MVVDAATSEWIPIVLGVPQGNVLGPLLFILYISEICELLENRLYAHADDSTLVAVVCKPAHRSAVAASVNRDLARIQEWCNHWCMILNANKTKVLVVSYRSRTGNPRHGDLILSRASISDSPNLDILGVEFDSRLTFEDHVRGIVSCVSQRIIILCWKCVFMDTSVLLRFYYAFVLPLLEYCSQVWGLLLNVILSFLSLGHRRHDAALCMLYKVNSNSSHCLFSEILSASVRV